jgi:tryptophan synthase alpha chain
MPLLAAIEAAGADLVEIGMPFSDPVADGPVIQRSSNQALESGMSVERLFEELEPLRPRISLPVFLMGYFNPVLAFGVERFVNAAARCGIDGVILPDLPVEEFDRRYRELFEMAGLDFIGLLAPATSDERAREIDRLSSGFLYAVGGAGTTGNVVSCPEKRDRYLSRIRSLGLSKPVLVGFGVRDRESFQAAARSCRGAIIGTAFVELLSRHGVSARHIAGFVNEMRKG